jgi:hypothetical protein
MSLVVQDLGLLWHNAADFGGTTIRQLSEVLRRARSEARF